MLGVFPSKVQNNQNSPKVQGFQVFSSRWRERERGCFFHILSWESSVMGRENSLVDILLVSKELGESISIAYSKTTQMRIAVSSGVQRAHLWIVASNQGNWLLLWPSPPPELWTWQPGPSSPNPLTLLHTACDQSVQRRRFGPSCGNTSLCSHSTWLLWFSSPHFLLASTWIILKYYLLS